MATISTYTFPQLTDLVQRSFQDWLENLPQVMRNSGIVVEEGMGQNEGEHKRFAERIDIDQYAKERDEWDVATQALVQYGYEKDGSVYTIAKEVSITKRMRVAGKERQMIDKITSLSKACPNTIDHDLALRLTFAWSTSYTDRNGKTVSIDVGDDLALISAVHTLTGSATTYSNQIPGNPQFSKGSLENAEKLFSEETYNNLGEKDFMNGDCIGTTDDPNTINQVRELMNSEADVSTDNSWTFNVYKNKYEHIVSGRIATTAAGAVDTTKSKYWFLMSKANSDFYLSMLENPYVKTPMDGNNGEEFSSENWNYLAAATLLIAIVTGRWIKGSKWDWS